MGAGGSGSSVGEGVGFFGDGVGTVVAGEGEGVLGGCVEGEEVEVSAAFVPGVRSSAKTETPMNVPATSASAADPPMIIRPRRLPAPGRWACGFCSGGKLLGSTGGWDIHLQGIGWIQLFQPSGRTVVIERRHDGTPNTSLQGAVLYYDGADPGQFGHRDVTGLAGFFNEFER
ncbi:hypothetical protein GCM10027403_03170 [Arthrobacter tecti]